MKISRMLTSLAFVSLLGTGAAFADAKKTDKPAAEATIKDEDLKKANAFIDALLTAITSNTNDCDKMATQIGSVLDAHAATIKMINEHKAAGRKPPKEFEDKLKAKQPELMGAIMKCKDNANVQASIQRLMSVMGGGTGGAAPPADKPAEKTPEKKPAKPVQKKS